MRDKIIKNCEIKSMPSLPKKIRVVHYCNQLSIGGTERTMEIFCKYLDRSRFEVFAVSRIPHENLVKRIKVDIGAFCGMSGAIGKRQLRQSLRAREPNFRELLGVDHVLLARNDKELRKILLSLKPDILHVHYSGAEEPPISDEEVMSKVPVTVTTNPFERENTAPSHRHVKKILFVSKWLLENKAQWAKENPRAGVLYNPIEAPFSHDDLRDELGIPKDAFVVGRVGRPDPGIHDPISLRAFRKIANDRSYFIALSPPENMLRQAKALALKNFIPLPPSTDPVFLSKFYSTIDVLAHARRDGETFGCNIAEAMIHGKPVISHLTPYMNAQTEVIGDTGYVCAQDDWTTYGNHLENLRGNQMLRAELSMKAQKRALEHFEARKLTRALEKIYLKLLEESSA
jgi:glycosyltransferase involved in cell wall biosynthesis